MNAADAPVTWSALSAADVPALTALLNEIDRHDELGDPVEEPSIREWLQTPRLDLAEDTVALRAGEQIVGFGLVTVSAHPDRDGRHQGAAHQGDRRQRARQGLDPQRAQEGRGTPPQAPLIGARRRHGKAGTGNRSGFLFMMAALPFPLTP